MKAVRFAVAAAMAVSCCFAAKRPNFMTGLPNGALAYGWTNSVEVLDGAAGFYVEAAFPPAEHSRAALAIAPSAPRAGAPEMAVEMRATPTGLDCTVRNCFSGAGWSISNPNAARRMGWRSDRPLTLGVSYDPWHDHVVFWANGGFVLRVESPYVPRCASAATYAATFGGNPDSSRAYSAAAVAPRCPPCPAAGAAGAGLPAGAAAYGLTRRVADAADAELDGKLGFYVEAEIPCGEESAAGVFCIAPTPLPHESAAAYMAVDVDGLTDGGRLRGVLRQADRGDGAALQYRVDCPVAAGGDGRHTVGVAFDPKSLSVTWWVDGRLVRRAAAPFVPVSARGFRYRVAIPIPGRKVAVYVPGLCGGVEL